MSAILKAKPYHHYVFLRVYRTLHQLDTSKIASIKKSFIEIVESEKEIITFSYSTLGLKGEIACMLWMQTDSIPTYQKLMSKLLQSELGAYLEIAYTLFGIVPKTTYVKEGEADPLLQERLPFLVIYPFTKTTEWYMLPKEERRAIMGEHIATGKTHPEVRQLLLHAYGIDDHEFVLSYEMQTLEEFQKVILDMRQVKVRAYTKNDLPIFTCVYGSLQSVIDSL
jgi:chlorite dismutase